MKDWHNKVDPHKRQKLQAVNGCLDTNNSDMVKAAFSSYVRREELGCVNILAVGRPQLSVRRSPEVP